MALGQRVFLSAAFTQAGRPPLARPAATGSRQPHRLSSCRFPPHRMLPPLHLCQPSLPSRCQGGRVPLFSPAARYPAARPHCMSAVMPDCFAARSARCHCTARTTPVTHAQYRSLGTGYAAPLISTAYARLAGAGVRNLQRFVNLSAPHAVGLAFPRCRSRRLSPAAAADARFPAYRRPRRSHLVAGRTAILLRCRNADRAGRIGRTQ